MKIKNFSPVVKIYEISSVPNSSNTTDSTKINHGLERHTKEARNGRSKNTFVPELTEEYITQVSEEMEERITKNVPGI